MVARARVHRHYSWNGGEDERPFDKTRGHQAGLLLEIEGLDHPWGGAPKIFRVVHFGEMAATAKPWSPSKSNDPGPAWAAAERDRLTRAHDDRALVARAQARGHQDVDRLVVAPQDHPIRTARLDAPAAARQAPAPEQRQPLRRPSSAATARGACG